MMQRSPATALAISILLLLFTSSCTPPEPKDYSVYREHMPASILVLPPINQSIEVNAGYSVLSTVTAPLATAGYYVFPVAVVDTYFKENGLSTPADMHAVPLDKLREVFGADAVLYLDVKTYGQDYNIVSSASEVECDAKLVDTATGLTLWEGRAAATQSTSDNGSNGLVGLLVGAALAQAVGTTFDASHSIAIEASRQMVLGRDGLLLGPYHQGQALDARGLPPPEAAAAESAAAPP
ncbi:MAG: DUF799 domain-containing protein [Geminicoccaceae bacterium]